ncbi:hypothetical protein [Mucilaginibacter endophyticus]|uniref:hypothetical protein n=1 Tax=Mucilaginibacter endophyticus TaxID=2675003 RepID=UPI000E0D4AA1|nr:hypothetical protein [Mucilaginibacter endophyticus]
MKKLILAAVVSLFAINTNAQMAQPQTLNTTEQAVTFTVNVTSMLKITMPRVGQAETAKLATAYTTLPYYKFANQQQSSSFSNPYSNEDIRISLHAMPNHTFIKTQDDIELSERLKVIFPLNSFAGQSAKVSFASNHFPENHNYRLENMVAGI